MKYVQRALLIVVLWLASISVVAASPTLGTIDPRGVGNWKALFENSTLSSAPTLNFGKFTTQSAYNITVSSSELRGFAWGEGTGWIITNCADTTSGCSGVNGNFKVANDGNGNLSGYAWGENTGWVNFGPFTNPAISTVKITSGLFGGSLGNAGYAWAQNYGWIKFDCSNPASCVETDWGVVTTSPPGGGVSGGYIPPNTPGDICSNIIGNQTIIPNGMVIASNGYCIAPQQCNALDNSIKQPTDIIIVMDRSWSMAGIKNTQAKNAAISLVDSLLPGSDRVSYINYSDTAIVKTNLTDSFDETKSEIQATALGGGGTNIGIGIRAAYQEMAANGRPGVKQVVIVLTDGEANISSQNGLTPNQWAISQATITKQAGMIVYSVGLGTSVDSNLLSTIATAPSYYYYSPTGLNLSSIYVQIASFECTVAPSEINGSVVYDANGNSTFDNGETGLLNVEISLISANNAQPTRKIASSTYGNYSLAFVPPGDYLVCATPPSGMFQTYPTPGICHTTTITQGTDVGGLNFLISGTIPPNPPTESCIDTIRNQDETGVDTGGVCDQVTSPGVGTCADNIRNQDETGVDTGGVCGDNQATPPICELFPNLPICNPTPPPPTPPTPPPGTDGETADAILGGDNSISNLFSSYMGSFLAPLFPINGENGFINFITAAGLSLPVASSIVSFVVANPIIAKDLPLLVIQLWNSIMIALGFKKRKEPWGIVYDSVTKHPIDPAYVVLLDMAGNEVATTITDMDGRYGFAVDPGTYRIIANKTNYQFPSAKLSGKSSDGLYDDLYFGGEVVVAKEGEIITKNIPLDQLAFDWNEYTKTHGGTYGMKLAFYRTSDIVLYHVSRILFMAGFAYAIYAFIFSPVLFNSLILGLYVIMALVQLCTPGFHKKGSVLNKETKKPRPFSVVRIISAVTNQEVAHKVADRVGNYYGLVHNGLYTFRIDTKKEGEDLSPVVPETGERAEYDNHVVEKYVKVKRGYLKENFKV